MKRIIALFLLFLISAVFFACDKAETDKGVTTKPTVPEPYTTVIDGKKYTAQKLSPQEKDYQIGYYNENNQPERFEYYTGGKLSYYYISSEFDDNGNDNVQIYYSADGKLLGTVKNGKFYNSSGKEISESELDALLPQ